MNKEKELDMNDLIVSFGECSTDYTKTACTYYANYLEEYQKEKIKLEQENQQLHNKIDKAIRYIKKNKHYIDIEDMNMYLYEDDINKVLEILKDSDVDE